MTVFEILIDIFVFFVGLTKIVCVQSKYPNKSSASLLCSISQVHIYMMSSPQASANSTIHCMYMYINIYIYIEELAEA